jgi:Fe-S cluster biogenesis protein NfuA
MEITDDGYAILQFGGGCNGCSMIDVTLKAVASQLWVDLRLQQILNALYHRRIVRDLTHFGVRDTELKFEKLSAYVDELSAPYLEDAEIDFVTDNLGSQLWVDLRLQQILNALYHRRIVRDLTHFGVRRFQRRKVSDDAPMVERVEYLLQAQINPQLAGHGGRVSLWR